MRENPFYLPFLRDLARLDWPAYDGARLVLADLLDDRGDKRSESVRAAVPDVWDRSSWKGSRFVLQEAGVVNVQTYRGAPFGVSPRSRQDVLKHFQPLKRVRVVERVLWHSGKKVYLPSEWKLNVEIFSPENWRPGRPYDVVYLWALGDWIGGKNARTKALAEARARRWIARHPDEDYELVLPTSAAVPSPSLVTG